ncbi:MAG: S41 family peptidase [Xanthomonadales bacterium]|nr:S41 family peptidase [Xanthomonadales bacterium]
MGAALGMALLASLPACARPASSSPVTEAPQPAPRIAAEQLRDDFRHLYEKLQASHYDLFARRPRAEYDALFEQMLAGFDCPMGKAAASLEFQRFVAYGNVAHANVPGAGGDWEAFRAAGGRAFPLFLRVVGGRAYVADDYSGMAAVRPGREVLTVDGQPVLEWLAPMRRQVSADTDYLAYAQMETRLPMLVWLEHGEVDQFQLELADGAGHPVILNVPALDRRGFEEVASDRPDRFELDWNTREARIMEGGIAYLRPGPFYDNRPEANHPWDPAAFKAFIDEAFASFLKADTPHLLVDLRNNPGGDNSFSDSMIAWFADKPFRFSEVFDIRVSEAAIESNRKRLEATGGDPHSTSASLAEAYRDQPLRSRVELPIPLVPPRTGERFRGQVHVLVNRHSYSNAVLVAAIVQDYGFGTVLGEETADLASTFGAMETFTLPYTGIEVGFPKARILRPNGDPQARGVVPDFVIADPLEATASDVVLERAISIIESGANHLR